jgi:hypothetical protein
MIWAPPSRMDDIYWPKKLYQWIPHGRRGRKRLQQSWKSQVTDFMEADRHPFSLGTDRRLLAV